MGHLNAGKLNNLEDKALIQLIQEGNRRAFDQLFNRHWQGLYAYAYGAFHNHEMAEDAIQEVFVSLWERRSYIDIRNTKSFLYQAVKFQIAAQLRKVKFDELEIPALDSLNYVHDVEEKMDYQELSERLEKLVAQLPDRCREIFYMSRFENLSNQQIAEKLNISVRTVENQISNGMRYIGRHLDTQYLSWFLLAYIFC